MDIAGSSRDVPSYYGVPGYSAKLAEGVLGGHSGIIPGCPQLLWCTGILCQASRGCVTWTSRDHPGMSTVTMMYWDTLPS